METETPPVLALYPGRCGMCDKPIIPDEDIVARVDGEWCHDLCIESETGEA